MKKGIDLIAEERQRQIEKEGWTSKHDDSHSDGELLLAAKAYYTNNPYRWPWEIQGFKPTTVVRNNIKAGALVQAEIDRLKRFLDNIASEIDFSNNTSERDETQESKA